MLGRFCWWLETLFADRRRERKIGNEKRPTGNRPCFKTEWEWLCRMPGVTGRLVASSSSLCAMWAHRLLRQISKPACVEACGGNGASYHCQLRAGRGLVLRLRDAGDDWGSEVASAAFASRGSTSTWAGRKSSSQLGIPFALTGGRSTQMRTSNQHLGMD